MAQFMKIGRITALALALTFSGAAVTDVAAQDTTPTTQEDDGGFDDWGLLGLLGLAGLLGLKRREEHADVRVERRAVEQR
jgi:MYXO-CTERM domain-containing protein